MKVTAFIRPNSMTVGKNNVSSQKLFRLIETYNRTYNLTWLFITSIQSKNVKEACTRVLFNLFNFTYFKNHTAAEAFSQRKLVNLSRSKFLV